MAEEPQDPNQVHLPLEPEPVLLVPIRPWQHDLVTTAVMTAGTVALVVVLEAGLDIVLARFLPPWALWTVRIVMGVSFVLTMIVAILSDTARFVLRRWRDLRADWREE